MMIRIRFFKRLSFSWVLKNDEHFQFLYDFLSMYDSLFHLSNEHIQTMRKVMKFQQIGSNLSRSVGQE